MIDNNKQMSDAAEMAQFRFALIAPVIHNLYTDSSRTAYYKRITKDPLTFPDGSVKKISYRTVEKWVSLYSRFGIDSITPRSRDDKGSTRALNDAAIEEIYRLKKEFPRLNATQIYNQLISGGFIPATVNVSAVQRFIKKNDLKGARILTSATGKPSRRMRSERCGSVIHATSLTSLRMVFPAVSMRSA